MVERRCRRYGAHASGEQLRRPPGFRRGGSDHRACVSRLPVSAASQSESAATRGARGHSDLNAAMTVAPTIRTTNASIALLNLQSHIVGLELQGRQGHFTSRWGTQLVDLLTLRARILGRIADYEWAADLSEQLARAFPEDGVASLTRARTRACLHRFAEALADLDAADGLGLTGPELDAERAAI